jgi:hypothetical protein
VPGDDTSVYDRLDAANDKRDTASMADSETPFAPPFEDFGPVDAAFLATLDPELRAELEDAERRFAAGELRTVSHVDVEAAIERRRLEAMKAG